MRALREGTPLVGVIFLLHVAVPFVPNLPALSVARDDLAVLSSTVTQLWAVEAAIFSAALVALFFALDKVQAGEPTQAALDLLLSRIGLSRVLGLFVGTLLGTGLTVLCLLPAPYDWPLRPASLGSLPLLNFALLIVSLWALLRLTLRAAQYLHPRSVHSLTLEQAEAYAFAATRHERSAHLHRERHSSFQLAEVSKRPRSKGRGRRGFLSSRLHSWAARWKLGRHQEESLERDELIGLLNETLDRGIKALNDDDLPKLREVLDVLRAVMSGHVSGLAAARDGVGEHQRRLDEPEPLGLLLHNLCEDRVGGDVFSLVNQLVTTPAPRCAETLLWFPFRIWRLGLGADNHGVARFGLRLAVRAYSQISRLPDRKLAEQWAWHWRHQIYGPETFLTSEAGTGIRPPDVGLDRVLHYLVAAYEVQESLFVATAVALLHEDFKTCGDLLASRATMSNTFWPLRAPEWTFPEAARDRLSEVERAWAEGMVILIGLIAVSFYNGKDVENLLRFAIEVALEKDVPSLEVLLAAVAANLEARPDWRFELLNVADEAQKYARGDHQRHVYETDLQAWAFLLLAPKLLAGPSAEEDIPYSELIRARPELRRVLELVVRSRRRWKRLLPREFLETVEAGLKRKGAETPREAPSEPILGESVALTIDTVDA